MSVSFPSPKTKEIPIEMQLPWWSPHSYKCSGLRHRASPLAPNPLRHVGSWHPLPGVRHTLGAGGGRQRGY